MPLPAQHQQTLSWLKEVTANGTSVRTICAHLVSHLTHAYPHYHRVCIYMLEEGKLELWSWGGPKATEHTENGLSSGLCGFAASTGQLINVANSTEDDRYLQCFLDTSSEIVVPIGAAGRVYGEIAIGSDTIAAFTRSDEAFLSEICALLGLRAAAEELDSRPVPT